MAHLDPTLPRNDLRGRFSGRAAPFYPFGPRDVKRAPAAAIETHGSPVAAAMIFSVAAQRRRNRTL